MPATVEIDLAGIGGKQALLAHLGMVLEFGGLAGNGGWGMNWDALVDCLQYLETGGIRGTSKKFAFPLKLTFRNAVSFRTRYPKDFLTLEDILSRARENYRQAGRDFQYRFID